jgi:hypothetical protein
VYRQTCLLNPYKAAAAHHGHTWLQTSAREWMASAKRALQDSNGVEWILGLHSVHAVQRHKHLQAAGIRQPHLLPVNEKTPSFARKIAKLVPMAATAKKAYVEWRSCLHLPLVCALATRNIRI